MFINEFKYVKNFSNILKSRKNVIKFKVQGKCD